MKAENENSELVTKKSNSLNKIKIIIDTLFRVESENRNNTTEKDRWKTEMVLEQIARKERSVTKKYDSLSH